MQTLVYLRNKKSPIWKLVKKKSCFQGDSQNRPLYEELNCYKEKGELLRTWSKVGWSENEILNYGVTEDITLNMTRKSKTYKEYGPFSFGTSLQITYDALVTIHSSHTWTHLIRILACGILSRNLEHLSKPQECLEEVYSQNLPKHFQAK